MLACAASRRVCAVDPTFNFLENFGELLNMQGVLCFILHYYYALRKFIVVFQKSQSAMAQEG